MMALPPSGSMLCQVTDIPETGLALEGPGWRLALVRRGERITAFVNACAHFGVRLNAKPDGGVFDPVRGTLVCHVHYARYSPDDGRCLSGECGTDGLVPVAVVVRDGTVMMA